jgi:hypothetical protein
MKFSSGDAQLFGVYGSSEITVTGWHSFVLFLFIFLFLFCYLISFCWCFFVLVMDFLIENGSYWWFECNGGGLWL